MRCRRKMNRMGVCPRCQVYHPQPPKRAELNEGRMTE